MKNEDENELSGLGEPPAARDTSVEKAVRRERGLAGPRTGFVQRTTQFLRDTRAEMRRVSWPAANEVKNTTIITLIAVVFFAIYLFGVDRIWAFLIEHLRSWLGG